MKIRINIPLDIEVYDKDWNAAGLPKDATPETVCTYVARHLTDYSDGRMDLATETFNAFISPLVNQAVASAISSAVHARYGNRMFKTGPRSVASAGALLAEKRTKGLNIRAAMTQDPKAFTVEQLPHE